MWKSLEFRDVETIEIDKSPNKNKISESKINEFEKVILKKIKENTSNDEIVKILDSLHKEFKKKFSAKELVINKIGYTKDGHTYDFEGKFGYDYHVWLYEAKSPTLIEKEKIDFIFQIITNLENNQHYSAKYFFNKIIKHYGLTINDNEFSGGVNRSLYYFPLYLMPMKIIEKETSTIKVVGGKGGGIIKIRNVYIG